MYIVTEGNIDTVAVHVKRAEIVGGCDIQGELETGHCQILYRLSMTLHFTKNETNYGFSISSFNINLFRNEAAKYRLVWAS